MAVDASGKHQKATLRSDPSFEHFSYITASNYIRPLALKTGFETQISVPVRQYMDKCRLFEFEFEVEVVLEETLVGDADVIVEGVDKVDGNDVLDLITGLGLACISSRLAKETYLSWPASP